MSNETTPYASLLMEIRANRRESSTDSQINSPVGLTSLMSERSGSYGSQMFVYFKPIIHNLILIFILRIISNNVRIKEH